MAKPFWFKLFGQDSDNSLEQFWSSLSENGGADRIVGNLFFQLFATPARSDSAAATDSAPSAATAADRNPVFRSAEWPAMSIPANVQADLQAEFDLAVVTSAAAAADPGPESVAGEPAERIATIQYGTMPQLQFGGPAAALGGGGAADYVVLLSDNFEATLVYDARSKQLLPGGPGNFPELGDGPDDLLDLSGDFSGGFTLTRVVPGLDTIVVRPGNDYNLVTTDDLVDAGRTLTVSAMPLGAGDHMLFDGSAETDGRFEFFGSRGVDIFLGGGGDDRILGLGGADMLNGGGGSDTFAYTFASDFERAVLRHDRGFRPRHRPDRSSRRRFRLRRHDRERLAFARQLR